MRLDRAALTVLLLLAVLAAVQLIHYHPLLPDRVAVHFDTSGEPNGWDSKTEFVLVYGAIEAFIVLFGVAFAFFISKIPASLVNIPHREYWFAPERYEGTIGFLADYILWLEAATLGFLIATAQLVFKVNLGDAPPRLTGDFWYVMAAFVAVLIWLTVKIVLRFRRPS